MRGFAGTSSGEVIPQGAFQLGVLLGVFRVEDAEMNTKGQLFIRGFLRTVFIVMVGFSISGCTYSIRQYVPSSDNVDKRNPSQVKSIAVDKFESSEPGLRSMSCRASVQVATPNNVSFESYIEQAFIEELRLAGSYDPKSIIVVRGRLEKIDFSSGPFKGNWSLRLVISSNTNPGFAVDSTYNFPASWPFWEACDEVAQAFVPAVRQLINEVVSNPQFSQIAQ
jgi:hypothetical protein